MDKEHNTQEDSPQKRSQEAPANLKSSLVKTTQAKKISRVALTLIQISMHFIWAGDLYNFDMPQLFESIIIQRFQVTTVQVDFLYTLVGVISIVTTSVGSLMVSRVGYGFGALLFNTGAYVGILLCYIAIKTNNFAYMIIGRVLFGIGEGVAMTVQISIAEKWFSGKFLSVAVGLNRFAAFGGMSFAAYFEPQLFIMTRSLEVPFFFYGLACFSTVLASLSYYFLEIRNEDKLGGQDEENGYLKAEFGFKDLRRLSRLAWLVAFFLAFSVNTYYLFDANGTDCLMNRYGFSYAEAKNLMTILPIFGMILTPLFSIIILKIGRKGLLFILCGVLSLSANFLLYVLPMNPGMAIYVPITLYGLYYGLYNALVWTSIALVAPKQAVNLFVGVGIGMLSTGLTFLPLLAGFVVRDRDVAAYQNSILLQAGMALVVLVLGVEAARLDFRTGRLLDLPENDERVTAQRERMSRMLFRSGEGGECDFGESWEMRLLGAEDASKKEGESG